MLFHNHIRDQRISESVRKVFFTILLPKVYLKNVTASNIVARSATSSTGLKMGGNTKKFICGKCESNVTKTQLSVQCEKCKVWFHQKCTENTEIELKVLKQLNNKWLCEKCKIHTKNEIRRSIEPVNMRFSDSTATSTKNENDFKEYFEELKAELKGDLRDLKNDLKFYADQYELQKTQNAAFSEEIKILKNENAQIKLELQKLKRQFTEQDKEQRTRNIIIMGINSTSEDSKSRPNEVIKKSEKVLKYIEPNLAMSDVKIKIINHNKNNSPIMVICKTTELKNKIMENRKTLGKVTGDKCGIDSQSTIFLNEDMTSEQRTLFKEARALRNNGFKYVWTKAGKVYARKNENSEANRITCLEDIHTLMGEN